MDSNEDSSDQGDSDRVKPYIVMPTTAHTHTIILLHGIGSNGEEFGQNFLEKGRTKGGKTLPEILPGARFVFPTAQHRQWREFDRKMLNQWFDIARVEDPSYRHEVQLQGLAESAVEIGDLLRHEIAQVPARQIVLGGVSMGCAMSLSILLSLQFPLGGFIGMSGYLPFQLEIEDAIVGDDEDDDGDDNPLAVAKDEDAGPSDRAVRALDFERGLLDTEHLHGATTDQTAVSTPVFLGHGDADDKKPYVLGEGAVRAMRMAGYNVDWKLYLGLGYWDKILEEIDDIVTFISEKVGWEMAVT
ncbi:phospholipase/carboxylesterase [Nemania serpens]|nr:phospholipase/carboxylesterase [Nemania serpens]